MSENKIRISKLSIELNIGTGRILSFLQEKGYNDLTANSKISEEIYQLLVDEFHDSKELKQKATAEATKREDDKQEFVEQKSEPKSIKIASPTLGINVVGKMDMSAKKEEKPVEAEKPTNAIVQEVETKPQVTPKEPEQKVIMVPKTKLKGPVLTGQRVDLSALEAKTKPVASSSGKKFEGEKKKRKRIQYKPGEGSPKGKVVEAKDVLEQQKEIDKQVSENLKRLQGGSKKTAVKNRKEKRLVHAERARQQFEDQAAESKIIKIAEFATPQELSVMMNISVTNIIKELMELGERVSINQRLDAEVIRLIVEDHGFSVEFVGVDVHEAVLEEEDSPEELKTRPPVVTIMGHVDHGKTSLLDYIRKTNVIAGESGGITQHIGAYEVILPDGKQISFLDTPGHEAFTAMRARGAKVTDIVVIVIAADDKIMPQTKEAISHAQAAGVPMIFAINKIDKPTADVERIKGELSQLNLLVEDWGGKLQSQDISAKTGKGVPELMEKILLEAEMLELKANPDKNAKGTVIEASLDKGKGYLTTILVQNGTLKVGDYVLSGSFYGKVKALLDERGNLRKQAGPACPAVLLGLNGAPQAGDSFHVMQNEQEAKKIANKRMQLRREQVFRTRKHITLDELGRRIALGDFKELNVIVKGDVDGSVEALSDSLQKLTTEEINVNIIHKAVGQISESDVMLASASEAVIVGFQVRPSLQARKLAETEQIDIRLYSVIYKAIEELKQAMEGMLSPDIEEETIGSLEIREVFKISRIGSIAGCMVLDGKISKSTKVRIIRDGVVIYTGELSSLKRFKEDVKEVSKGYECGLSIDKFNDIKAGDIIEGFEKKEIQRKLD